MQLCLCWPRFFWKRDYNQCFKALMQRISLNKPGYMLNQHKGNMDWQFNTEKESARQIGRWIDWTGLAFWMFRPKQRFPRCGECFRWWSSDTGTHWCRWLVGPRDHSSHNSWCPPARSHWLHDTSAGHRNPPLEAQRTRPHTPFTLCVTPFFFFLQV